VTDTDAASRCERCRLAHQHAEARWIRTSVTWRTGVRANIVLHADPSSVVVATFVQLLGRRSRIMWRLLTPAHELSMWCLLSLAVGRNARDHRRKAWRLPRLARSRAHADGTLRR
jgi:hypothetical protein